MGTRCGKQLSDGSPCLINSCTICCIETEMPLTEEDQKRIERLGFKRTEFIVKSGSETRLRNTNNHCFFLESNVCKIYESRPEGCRIYPLVYDVDAHKFIYDPECPHCMDFKVTREDKNQLKRLIRRLERKKWE